ncbi:hypothetical protein FCM35_KLT04389 [Carex littledalei]|uniref:Uncharacterized protein n=1 Tax=Carex littledalei TaxID=544730 RepID=A0A833VL78_9POAL|nr:hypothetical protein FCM35_KLT04389 [Carex littledalei]
MNRLWCRASLFRSTSFVAMLLSEKNSLHCYLLQENTNPSSIGTRPDDGDAATAPVRVRRAGE